MCVYYSLYKRLPWLLLAGYVHRTIVGANFHQLLIWNFGPTEIQTIAHVTGLYEALIGALDLRRGSRWRVSEVIDHRDRSNTLEFIGQMSSS